MICKTSELGYHFPACVGSQGVNVIASRAMIQIPGVHSNQFTSTLITTPAIPATSLKSHLGSVQAQHLIDNLAHRGFAVAPYSPSVHCSLSFVASSPLPYPCSCPSFRSAHLVRTSFQSVEASYQVHHCTLASKSARAQLQDAKHTCSQRSKGIVFVYAVSPRNQSPRRQALTGLLWLLLLRLSEVLLLHRSKYVGWRKFVRILLLPWRRHAGDRIE